ncbi:Alcohol acetyltransferase [Nakaseomyces glabratus]
MSRSLSSYERKLLSEILENNKNGTVFGASYIFDDSVTADEHIWDDDNDTLAATRVESRSTKKPALSLTLPLVTRALKSLIEKNPEMYTTVNDLLEFAPLKEIRTPDVISVVTFDNEKDEKVNCHSGGPPPYLIRHILKNDVFQPGSNKPLWNLYLIDESQLVFHCQDILFDIFSAANFHKLFLKELIAVCRPQQSYEKPLEYLFQLQKSFENNYSVPKSIYDNLKLHLPATRPELLNLQTQSFFKSIFCNAVKKPLDFIQMPITSITNSSSNSDNSTTIISQEGNQLKLFRTRYTNILTSATSNCGHTIFGSVSNERFNYLNSVVKNEKICLRSFIAAITMLCLKPMVKSFNGTLIFSMPMNLRDSMNEKRDFGLVYKDIRVECPLSMIDDKQCSVPGLNESDPEYNEKLLEIQFQQIATYVTESIEQRMSTWKKYGYNDNDMKRMKFTKYDEKFAPNTRLIKINDVSEVSFDDNDIRFPHIKSPGFTTSLSQNTLMSLSYTHCEEDGLNICIHYPDGYNMENFVDCFESFMEEQ